jgi:hypothetical protein
MPFRVSVDPFKIALSSNVLPTNADSFWYQAAAQVGLNIDNFTQPSYSHEDKQAIAKAVGKRLETQHVIMIFEGLLPGLDDILVNQFWMPLASAIDKIYLNESTRNLLLFLLDNMGYGYQVFPSISLANRFHTSMPAIAHFDEAILEKWVEAAQEEVADESLETLLWQESVVKDILNRTGGIPEEVLKYICDSCEYGWDGQFSEWLKP